MKKRPEPLLWLNDARGINIPCDFANSFNHREHVTNVDAEQWAILEAGPNHGDYWETWAEVIDSAIYTDTNGQQYFIHQDGDCWLIPMEMVWSDEEDFFVYDD